MAPLTSVFRPGFRVAWASFCLPPSRRISEDLSKTVWCVTWQFAHPHHGNEMLVKHVTQKLIHEHAGSSKSLPKLFLRIVSGTIYPIIYYHSFLSSLLFYHSYRGLAGASVADVLISPAENRPDSASCFLVCHSYGSSSRILLFIIFITMIRWKDFYRCELYKSSVGAVERRG